MIVYLLVNTANHKAYVGQHKGNRINKRWNNKMTNNSNPYLRAAIRKYGAEMFEKVILGCCETRTETDNLERLWIAILKTCDPRFGYNIERGGVLWRGQHSRETIQRISELAKERWRKRSKKWRAQFSRIVRRNMLAQWERMTEAERKEFGRKVGKALRGRKTGRAWNKGLSPAPNRGVPRPKHTEEEKLRITQGLLRFYRKERNFCGL